MNVKGTHFPPLLVAKKQQTNKHGMGIKADEGEVF